MIIRKPYAFLIKNFKKIHIVLLLLSIYVASRLIDVSDFIGEFLKYGTYDLYANPVSKYINTGLNVSLLLISGFSIALMILLKYKNKPWKIYLIPLIEYLILYFTLIMIKGFFGNYTTYVESTDLRFSRDLLNIFMIGQLPAIYVFIMRTFGLDVKKFNFNSDSEFLELSEEDREEFEISISIDKNTIKRQIKKFIRHLRYFYLEHKIICSLVAIILCIFSISKLYGFIFVTNKSYKEGEMYNVNGLSIVVDNTYYSQYDYAGNIISNKNNFVIVELTVINRGAPQTIDMSYFHLKNSNKDYTTSRNLYSTEFQDLGITYKEVKEVKRDETVKFIIIYRVDKKLNPNNFVLYYQETNDDSNLRKYKLKVKNLDKNLKEENYVLGDTFPINIFSLKDEISFDEVEMNDTFKYRTFKCDRKVCETVAKDVTAKEGYKILKISFSSTVAESKNMIDFVSKYGIFIYKDRDGYDREVEFENPIKNNYYGKVIFVQVPNDFDENAGFTLQLNVRGNKSIYKLS